MCKANNAVGNFIFLLGGFSCWANHELRKNEDGPREIQKVGEILPSDLYIWLLPVSTAFSSFATTRFGELYEVKCRILDHEVQWPRVRVISLGYGARIQNHRISRGSGKYAWFCLVWFIAMKVCHPKKPGVGVHKVKLKAVGYFGSKCVCNYGVGNLSPAMGARNQIGIGLSYRPASLCSLATQFQTRFLELIPRPIAGLKFSTRVCLVLPVSVYQVLYSQLYTMDLLDQLWSGLRVASCKLISGLYASLAAAIQGGVCVGTGDYIYDPDSLTRQTKLSFKLLGPLLPSRSQLKKEFIFNFMELRWVLEALEICSKQLDVQGFNAARK